MSSRVPNPASRSPAWMILGEVHAELRRQAIEGGSLAVSGYLDDDGRVEIQGVLDLPQLIDAVEDSLRKGYQK